MLSKHLINLKSYEKVKYVLRRHPFTFLPRVFLFIVLLLIPPVTYLLIKEGFPNFFINTSTYVASVLMASIFYLSAFIFFYAQFVEFYLDMWIITNDRIIDIKQLGLFSRSIAELDLFQIQDASTDVHGIFPTIINYGTVTIKTASSNNHIVAIDIPNPNKIREELINLSHFDRQFHTGLTAKPNGNV